MACATLKRGRDWEMMSCSGTSPHGSCTSPSQLPLAQPLPNKRRRYSPGTLVNTQAHSQSQVTTPTSSRIFGQEHNNARLTPERMAQEICDEIKRLLHRKQLKLSNAAASGSSRVDSDGSSSGSEGDSPPHPHSRALFTFKQVRVICERMLREQEAALRTEFEGALSRHLADQYEAFVRFNADQIQRRYNTNQDISYLS